MFDCLGLQLDVLSALLAALAKRTDNDVDDSFVRHLAVMLKV